MTISVGAASTFRPFSMIERRPNIAATKAINSAAVMKKVPRIIETPAVSCRFDIAAGAARPTPIIDSANAGRTWAKELFAAHLKPPLAKRALRKSAIMRNARMPIIKKAAMAAGNRYSTMLHSPGTKVRPSRKPTLTVIAKARGSAKTWLPAFEAAKSE